MGTGGRPAAPRGELAVVPGSPHNANYSATDHLAELVLMILRIQVTRSG
jgi:hypothetical protein